MLAHSLLRAVLHCHSPGVATAATVARRLRIDVHDDDDDNDNDNAWQRGLLWPHGMGPMSEECWLILLHLFETSWFISQNPAVWCDWVWMDTQGNNWIYPTLCIQILGRQKQCMYADFFSWQYWSIFLVMFHQLNFASQDWFSTILFYFVRMEW